MTRQLSTATDLVEQTREEYYKTVRPQQVIFRIAQLIVEDLVAGATGPGAQNAKTRGLASHQIFPEIVTILQQYVARKVKFASGMDLRELALRSTRTWSASASVKASRRPWRARTIPFCR